MRGIEGLRAGLAAAAPVALLLLIPAGLAPGGTWVWRHGLCFAGVNVVISIGVNVALALF